MSKFITAILNKDVDSYTIILNQCKNKNNKELFVKNTTIPYSKIAGYLQRVNDRFEYAMMDAHT